MKRKISYLPHLKIFLLCFSITLFSMLPEIILQGGKFLYYGDYIAQQIPFTMHLHEVIRNNLGIWDWFTELGTNIQNSYSFYMLFSPFFWILLPFPTSWIPYLIAPIYAVKIGLSGVFAFIAFNYFFNDKKLSFIGALLYACCGWQFCSMFFNHFAEPFLIFPLLLFSFEKCYKEGKWKLFVLSVGISAMMNYFFFFGSVIFIGLYFLCRTIFDKQYKFNIKNFWLLIKCGIAGMFIAAICIFPTFEYLSEFSRTSSFLSGKKMFLYSNPWHYLQILKGMILPPNFTGTEGFFPLTTKWATISLYLPIIGNVFTMVFLFSQKEKNNKWLKIFLILLFVFSFFPVLNSVFSLFNIQYYARWFYMFTFFNILATLIILNKYQEYIKEINIANTVYYVLSMGLLLISVFFVISSSCTSVKHYDGYQILFNAFFIISTFIFIKYFFVLEKNQKKIIVVFSIILIVYSTYMTSGSGFFKPVNYAYTELLNQRSAYNDTLEDFYRISSSEEDIKNIGLYVNRPSVETFISSAEPNSESFYSVFEERGVESFFNLKYNGYQSILSAKYIIQTPINENNSEYEKYEKIKHINGNTIYKNSNYVNFGFCYDFYMLQKDFDLLSNEEKNILVTKALVVLEKDEKIVSPYLTQLNTTNLGTIKENCKKLNENTISNLKISKNSFTGEITTEKKSMLFLSIPYSKHWNFYINNNQIDSVKVFNGLIALPLNKGKNMLMAEYKNDKTNVCAFISITSLFLLMIVPENNSKNKKREQ